MVFLMVISRIFSFSFLQIKTRVSWVGSSSLSFPRGSDLQPSAWDAISVAWSLGPLSGHAISWGLFSYPGLWSILPLAALSCLTQRMVFLLDR